ncbi:MAG: hypothetical protein BAJALOKI1v1_1580004 [Promethearchaeota archaeon]|nr:MAG: hypothetical protein BAJALOKI1v1_1580004 [Candidatus Lokiarchaeota archaeon]
MKLKVKDKYLQVLNNFTLSEFIFVPFILPYYFLIGVSYRNSEAKMRLIIIRFQVNKLINRLVNSILMYFNTKLEIK